MGSSGDISSGCTTSDSYDSFAMDIDSTGQDIGGLGSDVHLDEIKALPGGISAKPAKKPSMYAWSTGVR